MASNCRNRNDCPLDGSCLTESVIYKCHVTQSENDEGKHYIGLTGGKFKDRWASHNHSFRHEKASKSTELSKYIWELKNKQCIFQALFYHRYSVAKTQFQIEFSYSIL